MGDSQISNPFKIQIARAITSLFHPFIWLIGGVLYIGEHELRIQNQLSGFLIISLIVILIPLLVYVLFKKKWSLTDRNITERSARTKYLYGIAGVIIPLLLLCLVILRPDKVITLSTVFVVMTIIIYALSIKYIQLSGHVGVITGISVACGFLYSPLFFGLLILTIPVGWSRYVLGDHSLKEVVLGFIVSAILAIILFGFL